MKATIGYSDLHIECIVGILPHERVLEQVLLIDVSLDYDIQAATNEEMDEAISYAEVAEYIKKTVQVGQYKLLETLASACLNMLFNNYPNLLAAKITVKKPAAIPQANYAFIELERSRS